MSRRLGWTRVVLSAALVGALSWAETSTGTAAETTVQAIQAVLAEDSSLAATRNHAPETMPVADAVRHYVAGLDAIDFGSCPEDFAAAFRRHRDAWQDSVVFLEAHERLRGEMHAVFDEIRGSGGETAQQLERLEKRIWDTWEEVEEAAEEHSALVDDE